jgi:hypothetical protein
MTLEMFLEALQKYKANDVYNPWNDNNPIFDVIDAAAIKTQHLTKYLKQRIPNAKYIMIAEALGFQGGRFSGIAMTSERIMLGNHNEVNRELVYPSCAGKRTSNPHYSALTNIQRKSGYTEPTATTVWKTIIESGVSPNEVILWNIFPFHPFDSAKGVMSNRKPRKEELIDGVDFFRKLLQLNPNAKLIAVGKQSKDTLASKPYNILSDYVARHPANGGTADFRKELLNILK